MIKEVHIVLREYAPNKEYADFVEGVIRLSAERDRAVAKIEGAVKRSQRYYWVEETIRLEDELRRIRDSAQHIEGFHPGRRNLLVKQKLAESLFREQVPITIMSALLHLSSETLRGYAQRMGMAVTSMRRGKGLRNG